jgi:hypothetical protein
MDQIKSTTAAKRMGAGSLQAATARVAAISNGSATRMAIPRLVGVS